MKRYGCLIATALGISFKKVKVYNMEFLMMLLHFIFSFSFIFLFWSAILNNFSFPGYWSDDELYFYAAMVLLSDGISEIFFPFRMLPSTIIRGDLNKYLIRPVNPLLLFLLDNINIIAVIEQIVISTVAIVVVIISQGIAISIPIFILALLMMILGIIVYQIFFASFSMLAFWLGDVSFFREVVFGLNDFRRYPLDIFSSWLRKVLTFILPISLIAFYPISLMLGKIDLNWMILSVYAIMLALAIFVFRIVWKAGLKRYEANS